ncbi:MAG: hypothetical protein LBF84_02075 [Holosporales bacterium]|nr:hypothetical protein [Holosporales bacterium]
MIKNLRCDKVIFCAMLLLSSPFSLWASVVEVSEDQNIYDHSNDLKRPPCSQDSTDRLMNRSVLPGACMHPFFFNIGSVDLKSTIAQYQQRYFEQTNGLLAELISAPGDIALQEAEAFANEGRSSLLTAAAVRWAGMWIFATVLGVTRLLQANGNSWHNFTEVFHEPNFALVGGWPLGPPADQLSILPDLKVNTSQGTPENKENNRPSIRPSVLTRLPKPYFRPLEYRVQPRDLVDFQGNSFFHYYFWMGATDSIDQYSSILNKFSDRVLALNTRGDTFTSVVAHGCVIDGLRVPNAAGVSAIRLLTMRQHLQQINTWEPPAGSSPQDVAKQFANSVQVHIK